MFRIKIMADGEKTWEDSGRIFETEKKAAACGSALFNRWPAVREWRIIEIGKEGESND